MEWIIAPALLSYYALSLIYGLMWKYEPPPPPDHMWEARARAAFRDVAMLIRESRRGPKETVDWKKEGF